jgi:hypothetical protein
MRRASGFVLVAKWRVIRLAQGQNATSVTTSAFIDSDLVAFGDED